MGQQQLLLLVLGIIVVGLAVVIGVRAYNDTQAQQQGYLMMQTAQQIATDAQTWASLPAELGGGNSGPAREGYSGLSFEELGMPVGQSGFHENRLGFWDVRPTGGQNLVIEGVNPAQRLCVTLRVEGVSPQRITREHDAECDRARPGSGSGSTSSQSSAS